MADVRSGAVTLKGGPVDLAGPALKAGDKAPDFKLQGQDLGDVTLSSSAVGISQRVRPSLRVVAIWAASSP